MISCLRKSSGGTDTLYPWLKLDLTGPETLTQSDHYLFASKFRTTTQMFFSLTSNLSGSSKSEDEIGGFP